MNRTIKVLAVVLTLAFCFMFAACAPEPSSKNEEQSAKETTALVTTPDETPPQETTPTETTPEETTPEQTTPEVTEPDFSNTPDPDGTKRY